MAASVGSKKVRGKDLRPTTSLINKYQFKVCKYYTKTSVFLFKVSNKHLIKTSKIMALISLLMALIGIWSLRRSIRTISKTCSNWTIKTLVDICSNIKIMENEHCFLSLFFLLWVQSSLQMSHANSFVYMHKCLLVKNFILIDSRKLMFVKEFSNTHPSSNYLDDKRSWKFS